MRAIRGIFFSGILLTATLAALIPARASLETDLIERWYVLLGKADANGLSGLLAPRARIQLDDLGVTQTKAEFIASMDEWRDAIDGGTIKYRFEKAAANGATMLVCYHFRDNQLLARETFKFVNGRITESIQQSVGEDCGDL